MPELCQKSARNLPGICQNYARNMPDCDHQLKGWWILMYVYMYVCMYSCIYVHVDKHNLGSSLKTISRQHGYSHNNNNEKQDIQPRYDLKFCLLRLRAVSSRSMMVIASACMQLLVSLRPTALTSSKPSAVKRAILISSFLNPSLKLACSRASSRQFVHQDFALDDEETAS